MPHIKFTYFDAKALGEPVRMLLAYGNQEYEDVRIPWADWPAFKSKTMFGQLPLFEIDGKVYAQSLAISRYLARLYGLTGRNPQEDMEIDMNLEFLIDIKNKAATVHYELDEALKAKKLEDFSKNVYPDMLGKLHAIIEKNKGHLALGKFTWGDIFFSGMYKYLKYILHIPDIDEKYPAFKKLQDSVLAIPKLKKYVANLTETELPF